jgi:hypothetical protein
MSAQSFLIKVIGNNLQPSYQILIKAAQTLAQLKFIIKSFCSLAA